MIVTIGKILLKHKIFILPVFLSTVVALDFVYFSHSFYSLSFLLIDPVCQFNLFLIPLFCSFMIAWESHQLKTRRDRARQFIATYLPMGYDQLKNPKNKEYFNDGKGGDVMSNIEENHKQLLQIYKVEVFLYLSNLTVGGYTALCISNALLTESSVC